MPYNAQKYFIKRGTSHLVDIKTTLPICKNGKNCPHVTGGHHAVHAHRFHHGDGALDGLEYTLADSKCFTDRNKIGRCLHSHDDAAPVSLTNLPCCKYGGGCPHRTDGEHARKFFHPKINHDAY